MRLCVCLCVCLCLCLYLWQSNRAWNDAAASQDGSHVVALIEGYDYLYTSADAAASWTPRAGTLFRVYGLGSRVWACGFGGLNPGPVALVLCTNTHTHRCARTRACASQRCEMCGSALPRDSPFSSLPHSPPLPYIWHLKTLCVRSSFVGGRRSHASLSSYYSLHSPPPPPPPLPPSLPLHRAHSSPISHALLLTLCLPRVLYQKRWLGRVWLCPPTGAGLGERVSEEREEKKSIWTWGEEGDVQWYWCVVSGCR
jgi:hypothetical protein